MGAFIFAGGDPSKVDVSGYVKGDVLAADTTGTLQPVPVGPDSDVLTADSGAAEGVDWQAGGGGGGGTPSNTVVTETTFGQTSTAGVATAYSRGDHTHGTPTSPSVPSAGSTVVTETSFGQASTAGVSAAYSRTDHTHGTPTAPTVPAAATTVVSETSFGQAAVVGTATIYARQDHTHGTPAAPTAASVGADPAGAAAAAQAASQPLDADLTTIAGLTATTGNVIQAVASAWASQTPAQLKTSLTLVKGDVGLGNVDNTSDANKPVSTATQTALNLKANLASPTFTGTVTTPRLITPNVALTDAATIAVDASLSNHFRVLLTAAVGATRQLGAPTNPTDGQMITIEVIQSATGTNALTYNAAWGFGADITGATLSTAANKHDFIGAIYNSTSSLWYVIAFVKGY
jgi:hypothetical protein